MILTLENYQGSPYLSIPWKTFRDGQAGPHFNEFSDIRPGDRSDTEKLMVTYCARFSVRRWPSPSFKMCKTPAQETLKTFCRLTPSSPILGEQLHSLVIDWVAGHPNTHEAPSLPRTFLNSLQLDGLAKAFPGCWWLATSGIQGYNI